MIVQLFFIGIYLNYLFLWDNPWINFLWVIVMIFVASQTALARTQLKRKILLLPISAGFLCSVVCVGLYFIGIVLRVESVFSALGGWLLLHQNLSIRESSGCVLLFAAVVLAQLPLGRLMRSKA